MIFLGAVQLNFAMVFVVGP